MNRIDLHPHEAAATLLIRPVEPQPQCADGPIYIAQDNSKPPQWWAWFADDGGPSEADEPYCRIPCPWKPGDVVALGEARRARIVSVACKRVESVTDVEAEAAGFFGGKETDGERIYPADEFRSHWQATYPGAHWAWLLATAGEGAG
jgi:hypothetical protein